MNEQTQRDEISDLIERIYQADAPDTEPRDESQPRRRLNVYIEVEEEEIDSTIESTLEEKDAPTTSDQAETPSSNEQQSDPLPVQSSRTRRIRPVLFVLLLVAAIGLLVGLGYGIIFPIFAPEVTVTLVTQSQRLTTTSTLQLMTNVTADPTKQQVPGRELTAITMSQQKTVATTGTAHQDARAGHGIITFYNGATYTQTVTAGTILTGADGTQFVTDADATIPAAIFPTFGQASVYAHAAITGPQGNIRAGDLYDTCCRLNVSAVNGAFTGGHDARTYQTVTPQDINGTAASVTTSLEQSVQAALQTQVQPDETLVTPLDCTQKVTPNHAAGDETAQVSITIDETCTGTVYTTQAVTTLTKQNAAQDAEKRLGTGYTTTGIQTSITQATRKEHSAIDLQVKSVSMWAYQYGPEQEQRIRAMIAGMSQDRAKTTLLHLAGVQSVSITTTNSATIPTDTAHIHLMFLEM